MNNYFETLLEAKRTSIALMILIAFWLVAGFGVASVDLKIFSVPLWAILGTIGVWLFGVIISISLSRSIKDTKL